MAAKKKKEAMLNEAMHSLFLLVFIFHFFGVG